MNVCVRDLSFIFSLLYSLIQLINNIYMLICYILNDILTSLHFIFLIHSDCNSSSLFMLMACAVCAFSHTLIYFLYIYELGLT